MSFPTNTETLRLAQVQLSASCRHRAEFLSDEVQCELYFKYPVLSPHRENVSTWF